jgi:phosphate transport system substrate-binding protein
MRITYICKILSFFLNIQIIVFAQYNQSAQPKPPTIEDKSRWLKQGRELPTRELLQPTLDSELGSFVPKEGKDLAGEMRGAASDVLADIARRWIASFSLYYPNVHISVPPPYSGQVGAKELVKGDVDFALVSRELVPSDVVAFRAKFGYSPLSIPIMGGTYRHFGFLDAVAFFVNKDNPINELTFKQLDGLLSTTNYRGSVPIRTWDQLGLKGEWTDKKIEVYAVKPWNGFEEFVRERVLCTDDITYKRGEWRKDLHFSETVFPISPAVASDKYAIGYSGLAYLTPGVKLIAVSDSETGRIVPPTYDEIAKANYPLSRLVYVNINKNPLKDINPILKEFIRFIVSKEGQSVVLDQAVYIPLRGTQSLNSLSLLGVK